MIRLRTGTETNADIYSILEKDDSLKAIIIETFTGSMITESILSGDFTPDTRDKQYTTLCAALTCSDELSDPIPQRLASVLYFTLQVNYNYYAKINNYTFKIKTLSHANYMFDVCGGDYTAIDMNIADTEKHTKSYWSGKRVFHKILFPELDVIWNLPISVFTDKDTKEKGVELAGKSWATYALVSVGNEQKRKIPRFIFIKFFSDCFSRNGAVIGKTDDDIFLAFDENAEDPVVETLFWLGYTSQFSISCDPNVYYYYSADLNRLCAHVRNRNADLAGTIPEGFPASWVPLTPNEYFFNFNNGKPYIPTQPIRNTITIFTKD